MKYQHLLTPLKVNNVILKNRFMETKSLPHFLQGPETFPTESVIAYYGNQARNGASIVTVKAPVEIGDRKSRPQADMQRMAWYDTNDPSVENYFSHICDIIHYYGGKASISLHNHEGITDGCISSIPEDFLQTLPKAIANKLRTRTGNKRVLTADDMKHIAEHMAAMALRFKNIGFDMCNIYMTYRASLLSCALSPIANHRTDEYGGDIAGRARLPLEVCKAIKDACGKDFLVEIQITGEEDIPGGTTIADTVEFAKLAEGLVDIIHIRASDGDLSHPTGFNSVKEEPITLKVAEAIKKSGAKVVVAPNGGYQDPDLMEKWLSEGKCDMFAMARTFICDDDFYQKVLEGRGEDVIPCVRCNKCHVPSLTGPWLSFCTVNPLQGIKHLTKRLDTPTTVKKNVAVIGGGPAGMDAAIYAAQLGHTVTLYEKSDVLGGQLIHTDYASFKWPLRDFKDYLIRQLYKNGVNVQLGVEATPDMIANGGYDAVIAAVGAVPKMPNIPGVDGEGIWNPLAVYGHEAELGKKVVVVGGSETGTETGMYLAEAGHEVTVLTRQNALATDATPIHYIESFRHAWETLEGFSYILNASTTAVTANSVTYKDKDGAEHTIECDSVVVCGGVKSLQDEALSFGGIVPQFTVIGDALKVGNVHECTRQAYAAAQNL